MMDSISKKPTKKTPLRLQTSKWNSFIFEFYWHSWYDGNGTSAEIPQRDHKG